MAGSRLCRCPNHNCAPKPYGSLDGWNPSGIPAEVVTKLNGATATGVGPLPGTTTLVTLLTVILESTAFRFFARSSFRCLRNQAPKPHQRAGYNLIPTVNSTGLLGNAFGVLPPTY